MKERLMTRSGKYHGNPLNKYHSWGRGGGRYYTKFYTCYLLSKVQPLTLLYTIFDRKGTPFVHLPLTNGTPFMHLFWAYATGRQNWSQEDGKTFVLDKRDRAIAFVFCRDLHFTTLRSGFFFRDLFEGRWSLADIFFKHSYSHVCHTRCAVFFPLPFYCACSLRSVNWSKV